MKNKLPVIIFIAVILLFLVGEIVDKINQYNFFINADSATAIVTKVTDHYVSDSDSSEWIYVLDLEYTVDGKKVQSTIERKSGSIGVNDTVTVYYSPDDVTDIHLKESKISELKSIFSLIILFLIACSLALIFLVKRKENTQERNIGLE